MQLCGANKQQLCWELNGANFHIYSISTHFAVGVKCHFSGRYAQKLEIIHYSSIYIQRVMLRSWKLDLYFSILSWWNVDLFMYLQTCVADCETIITPEVSVTVTSAAFVYVPTNMRNCDIITVSWPGVISSVIEMFVIVFWTLNVLMLTDDWIFLGFSRAHVYWLSIYSFKQSSKIYDDCPQSTIMAFKISAIEVSDKQQYFKLVLNMICKFYAAIQNQVSIWIYVGNIYET